MLEIGYDVELVFKLFLETLERRFENINTLPEVKPLLKKISTSDEEILAFVQKAEVA